ncbi:MAG: CvpA family protein [Clostridiales bacterium]|nr:CvpA family protein [Clostridiales bacterium]
MNTYDIAAIAILGIFALVGWILGLVKSIGGIISWLGAIILTRFFYPYAAVLLRKTSLLNVLQEGFSASLPYASQTELFNELNQNQFIREQLMANNNSEVWRVFNISEEGYAAAFLANMVINLISVIVVFILAMIIMAMVVNTLNIAANLPLINIANGIGGAIVGLGKGIIILWLFLAAMNIYILEHKEVYDGIQAGQLSSFLFENNPVINWLIRISP